jgi:Uma2 family endonuclease
LVSAPEYLRMTEAGVFLADARLELVEGEIVEMAPIGSRHATVVNKLTSLIVRGAGDLAIVSVQNPVVVGERSVPQPDLVLLKPRADEYFGALPTVGDVLLVVEVADTSLRFDLDRKIPLYGRAGIVEAWVIDLDKRVMHRFGAPDPDSGYRTESVVSCDQKVSPAALPSVVIDIARLFPT